MANKFTDAVFNVQLPGESRNRVVLKAILMAVAWRTDSLAYAGPATHGSPTTPTVVAASGKRESPYAD
jgi:hypothetical protein